MPRLTTELRRPPRSWLVLCFAALTLRGRIAARLRRAGVGRPAPLDLAALGAPDSVLAR